MKILEHVLRAFVVEPLGVVRGPFLVHRARPVPLAFENFQYQMLQILEQHAQFLSDVVEEGLVAAALPAFLARFELLGASSHAQLDQRVLVAAHAVARGVDHVGHVLVRVGQRVAHHPPVVATRFALDVFAEVPIKFRAVLSLCPV